MHKVEWNGPMNMASRIASRLFDSVYYGYNSWVDNVLWSSTSSLYHVLQVRGIRWASLREDLVGEN